MRQFAKLFEANFKTTFREKSVWFWSIFYPVLLMVIFIVIFGGGKDDSSGFKAKIAVVAGQGSQSEQQLTEAIRQVPVLEWKEPNPVTREQAEQWIKKKDVDAAIVVPSDVADGSIELIFNKEKQNSTTTQAVTGIMNNMLQQLNYAQAGVEPHWKLIPDYISEGSADLKYTDFLLTGMIALAISQSGMFGLISLVEMRRNGLLKRLKMTPVNMSLFGMSDIVVRFVLSILQVLLLTLVGVLLFGAKLDFNPLSFLIVFIVGTISFSAIGFLIAGLGKSLESYMAIANLSSFIMMFLSGIFFDSSMLPDYIKPISAVLPLTFFVDGIRDGMAYGSGIMNGAYWLNIGVMAAWGAAAFAIGSKLYKWKA